MSFHRIKLLAAAIMLTGGLGMGLGTTWLANAQDPQKSATAELGVPQHAIVSDKQGDVPGGVDSKPAKKWEYYYIPQLVGQGSGIKASEFERLLADLEPYGWEFLGQVNMRVTSTAGGEPKGTGGVSLPTYVFRRPVKSPAELWRMAILDQPNAGSGPLLTQLLGEVTKPPQDSSGRNVLDANRILDDQARIHKLEDELATLKAKMAKSANVQIQTEYLQKDLPIAVADLQDILGRVGTKIGIKNLQIVVTENNGGTIQLSGPKGSVEWAQRLIQTLSNTSDSVKTVKP